MSLATEVKKLEADLDAARKDAALLAQVRQLLAGPTQLDLTAPAWVPPSKAVAAAVAHALARTNARLRTAMRFETLDTSGTDPDVAFEEIDHVVHAVLTALDLVKILEARAEKESADLADLRAAIAPALARLVDAGRMESADPDDLDVAVCGLLEDLECAKARYSEGPAPLTAPLTVPALKVGMMEGVLDTQVLPVIVASDTTSKTAHHYWWRKHDAVRAVLGASHDDDLAVLVAELVRERAEARAACRAAFPHHQGGHSEVGAMLRRVLGEKPNIVEKSCVDALFAPPPSPAGESAPPPSGTPAASSETASSSLPAGSPSEDEETNRGGAT